MKLLIVMALFSVNTLALVQNIEYSEKDERNKVAQTYLAYLTHSDNHAEYLCDVELTTDGEAYSEKAFSRSQTANIFKGIFDTKRLESITKIERDIIAPEKPFMVVNSNYGFKFYSSTVYTLFIDKAGEKVTKIIAAEFGKGTYLKTTGNLRNLEMVSEETSRLLATTTCELLSN